MCAAIFVKKRKMKIQSNLLATASGKLGGTVFRTTRHGVILSGRRTPKATSSIAQQVFPTEETVYALPSYRSVYAASVRKWGSLTEAERAFYNALAPHRWGGMLYYIYIEYSRALKFGEPLDPRPSAPLSQPNTWKQRDTDNPHFLFLDRLPPIRPQASGIVLQLVSDPFDSPVGEPPTKVVSGVVSRDFPTNTTNVPNTTNFYISEIDPNKWYFRRIVLVDKSNFSRAYLKGRWVYPDPV